KADLEQRKRNALEVAKMTREGSQEQRQALDEIAGAQKLLNAFSPMKASALAPPATTPTSGPATPTTAHTAHQRVAEALQQASAPLPSHERVAQAIQRSASHKPAGNTP